MFYGNFEQFSTPNELSVRSEIYSRIWGKLRNFDVLMFCCKLWPAASKNQNIQLFVAKISDKFVKKHIVVFAFCWRNFIHEFSLWKINKLLSTFNVSLHFQFQNACFFQTTFKYYRNKTKYPIKTFPQKFHSQNFLMNVQDTSAKSPKETS